MTRLQKTLCLAIFAFSGSVVAQDNATPDLLKNVNGSLEFLLPNLQASGNNFLVGNVTQGFASGNVAVQGAITELTIDTPLSSLADAGEQLGDMGFATLLPLYQTLDGPAMQLAALGSPLTDPLLQIIGGSGSDASPAQASSSANGSDGEVVGGIHGDERAPGAQDSSLASANSAQADGQSGFALTNEVASNATLPGL